MSRLRTGLAGFVFSGIVISLIAGTALAAPAFTVSTLAGGLEHPWSIAVAPDGALYVTERPGRLQRIDPVSGTKTPLAGVPAVRARAEAGLMGLALDPDFAANGQLYLCYSTGSLLGPANRLSRFTLQGDALAEEKILLGDLPGAMWHNGCRVAISPDGHLFASMGDATEAEAAQETHSLAGKIFRLRTDGTVPADNPIANSPIWSLGHRNPQGLAFNPSDGRLWSTEHGPDTQDELNLIEKGGNYGWPRCRGIDPCPGIADYRAAKAEFNKGSTVAISDLVFYQGAAFPEWQGDILFVTLKTGRLYRVDIAGEVARSHEILIDGDFGRLRAIALAPDGSLYLSTDNGKDRILHLTRR